MGANWQHKRIADVCSVLTDGDWIESKDQSPDGIRLIQTGNIGNGVFKDKGDKARYISEETFGRLSCTEIFEGDVLVSRLPEPIGRSCILPKLEQRTITAVDCSILRFKDELLNKFFVYYTLSPAYDRALNNYITGSSRKRISRSNLGLIKIPVPSMNEQQHIVDELDLLTGIIDKKNAQLRDLDALAQSIFYEMFGDPAVNEKGWPVKQISDLFDVGSSKRVFESEWRDSGVPFYRAREIVRLSKGLPLEDPIFIEESLFAAYKEKHGIPAAGDIMVTGVGTLGICYLVKEGDCFYFKDGNTLWFKDKHVSNSRFIKDQFLTEFVKDQIKGNSHGATVGTYTIVNAKKTRVICPPVKLQNEYEERVNAIDSQKRVIGKSLTETQNLLDSRMHNYFG